MEKECGCPKLDKKDWELEKHTWKRRTFYSTKHGLFFHVSIGIRKAIKKGMEEIKEKEYSFRSPYMMLEEEIGFLSANMLFAIEEIPKDDPNVVIWQPATLYSKYYQGPFKGLKEKIFELADYVKTKEKKEPTQIYTWITNCPRCWKEEGSPTTIIFARI